MLPPLPADDASHSRPISQPGFLHSRDGHDVSEHQPSASGWDSTACGDSIARGSDTVAAQRQLGLLHSRDGHYVSTPHGGSGGSATAVAAVAVAAVKASASVSGSSRGCCAAIINRRTAASAAVAVGQPAARGTFQHESPFRQLLASSQPLFVVYTSTGSCVQAAGQAGL